MEIQPQDYNIWAGSQTRNGFAADEIISSLQKAIRRAMEEQACQYAYELYVSGPIFLEKLWRRLLTISVEDIGFGNLNAAVYVNTMNEMRKNFPYDDGDQPMYFIHAIRILCSSNKDRSSDFLKNIIIKEAAMAKSLKLWIWLLTNIRYEAKLWVVVPNISLKKPARYSHKSL